MTPTRAPGHGPGLARFRRALRALGHLETTVAVLSFSAAVLLNVVQIGLRYLFETSIWWVQEISLLLMLTAYFVGASCVFRSRQYVVISFVVEHLPPRLQVLLYLITQMVILAFVALVGWQVLLMAPHMMRTRTVIIGMPQYYMALPLLYGSASILLTSIYYALAVWPAARDQPGLALAELEDRIRVA